MIRAELKNSYRTNYHLELVDSRTGRLKQSVDTHNVFTKNWWNRTKWNYGSAPTRFVYSIVLGSGSGTPSESDTGMFSQLWSIGDAWGNAVTEIRSIDVENKSVHVVATGTFPATSAYVGTITEIGIWSGITGGGGSWPTPNMMTHALLKDAEGNPISIVKSDTDILIVTITFDVFYSASSPWNLVKYPGYLMSAHTVPGQVRNQWVSVFFALGTTLADPNTYSSDYGPYVRPEPTAFANGNISMNMSLKKMSFTTARNPVEAGMSRPIYYSYLMFTGFCYAALPNANLFPNYDIKGIALGTGDGETVRYKNPLNYFVENSETIYLNGNALVRDVDYSIDYRNNANRLPELSATKNAALTGGVIVAAGTNNGHKQMLFQRMVNNVNSVYLIDAVSVGWRADAPLTITLEEASDVNTFYVPSWIVTGTITLSYSVDGENWNPADQFAHTSGTANMRSFDLVNAKYWRIEGTNATWTAHSFTTDDMTQELFLGYTGDPYITFTEPPADGDVITMDVQMDRPFKNGNFVIDVSAELQLS